MKFEFEPIGVMHSCFKERFGMPPQAGLVSAARGWIEFYPPYDREEAFVGLEGFSHVWLIFLFHERSRDDLSYSVQPPYQHGAELGLWATRTPNRPGGIGQSLVELERIEKRQGKVKLHLRGIGLIESTPIIDIKPYLPYADAIPEACSGFANPPQPHLQVGFATAAERQLSKIATNYSDLRLLIIEVLQLDPRRNHKPARPDDETYNLRVYDLRVTFQFLSDQCVNVLAVTPCATVRTDTPDR